MAELLQTQADKGINECFQYIEKLGSQRITKFLRYLRSFKMLKIEIQTRDLDKKNIMKQIKDNITIKDHETCETILRWVETNKQSLSPRANQNTYITSLQFSLEGLFHPPAKQNLSQDDRKHLLQCLAASKHLSIKEEKYHFNCIYRSISHSLKSIDRIFGEDEIRSKCLSFLKTNTIPLKPEQIKAILRTQSPIHDHVSKLDSPEASGDPFVFYAAAIVYKVHIHVISAVSTEEYLFYPDEWPSGRSGYDHIYIGHLYADYYTSLVNNVSVEVLMQKNKDLESRVKEYHDQIVKLQTQVNNLEAENARLKSNDNVKLTKDLKDRLQESEKLKQMLEDENKQLKSKLENIDKSYVKREEFLDLHKKFEDLEAYIYQMKGTPRNEKEQGNYKDPTPKEEDQIETKAAQVPQISGDKCFNKSTTSTQENGKSQSKTHPPKVKRINVKEIDQRQWSYSKKKEPTKVDYLDFSSAPRKTGELTPVEQTRPNSKVSK